MSSKRKKSAGVAVKVTQPSEAAAGERAENEGMPTRVSAPVASALEGEGSRTAAHHYEEGLKASIARGETGALAEEARRALDGSEAAALGQAESAARLGQSAKPAERRQP
jgi:hypothetical protein